MNALIDKYSIEELKNMVKTSYSLKEVIQKIGYKTCSGSNNKTVRKRIEEYNIDTSHFKSNKKRKLTEDDIFIEHSTVSQAVLRRWYKKNNYTPYRCSICNIEPIWQNKPLTLILDHINGINTDHRQQNLRWVCPNCNQQLETTNGKNRKKLLLKNHCKKCGKIISRNATYCKKCVTKKNNKNQQIGNNKIDKDTLKSYIRTRSFEEIGREFNISGNAIKKWCDKYSLPRTKKEINSYSDEEWINI